MADVLKSIVRTLVPVVVGSAISALATLGIEIDQEALTKVVDGIFIGGYYALVRYLEARFPKVGWLLGLPSAPHYDQRDTDR